MLLKIANTLYVGTEEGIIFTNKKDWSILHISQKYHYKIMGWDYKFNKPNKNNPNYLIYIKGYQLSVNLVDGPQHLYEPFGVPGFISILDFIEESLSKKRNVFIHCDKGKSRSPSVALLYLSKRTDLIKNNNSYDSAYTEFKKMYPSYNPGGISDYLSKNWSNLK